MDKVDKYKGKTPREVGIKYETKSDQDSKIAKWLMANDPQGKKYKTSQATLDSKGKPTTQHKLDKENGISRWKNNGGHKREFLQDVGRANRKNQANELYMDKDKKSNSNKSGDSSDYKARSSTLNMSKNFKIGGKEKSSYNRNNSNDRSERLKELKEKYGKQK